MNVSMKLGDLVRNLCFKTNVRLLFWLWIYQIKFLVQVRYPLVPAPRAGRISLVLHLTRL